MSVLRISGLLLGAAAVGALVASCTKPAAGVAETGQGWSTEAQGDWANATQGSRLIPLAWYKALAQPDGTAPFADNAYLATFRIVTQKDRLPVGFAVDDGSDTDLTVSKLRWYAGQKDREQWLGLNCAACHTAVIEYEDKEQRIDGGPALFDYQIFVEALDKALHQTLDSASAANVAGQARFDAFAKQVLATADTPANRSQLRDALAKLIAWEDKVEKMNTTSVRYGYGRVDAFGHIYNKVSLFNGAEHPTPNPASAPVSYPFLWDIYRHDKLQWNGIAENSRFPLGPDKWLDYGAMGRNTGEVIGVFGDIAVAPNAGLKGYKSSVQVANLERIERLLESLKAPKWPWENKGDIAHGEQLFKDHCQGCHMPQPGTAPYKVKLVPQRKNNRNNTDLWMACNAIRYTSAPGKLAGVSENYIGGGPKYTTEDARIASMLATTVKGALVGKKGEILAQAGRVFIGVGGLPVVVNVEAIPEPGALNPILTACLDANSPLMQYKARPLDGIWATAPYLHNGSVPNLYQLLLPPEKRVTRFYVGTRRYDPVNVGYQTDKGAPGNGFEYDTTLQANSNMGHDYDVGKLSDADRMALIAYMKTL
ncbi:MAG: hypothetical protein J7494_06365 [Sphingobium sp.]|nr:hypothetical protein [Sphingobium sp.]